MLPTAIQIGIPGTQELMIVVFIFLFFLAFPVLVVALVLKVLAGNDSNDERIAELEREVARLREERKPAAGSDDELE